MIQRIAMGHGMAGRKLLWKLQSMIRGGPRTKRFAASVDSINSDNSKKTSTGLLAGGLLCLSMGIALSACSSVTSTPLVQSEEKIMSSPRLAAAPLLDAPEVLRRLLALIDTLHQPQDLTIERVAQFSGFAMRPFSDKPTNDAYEIFQPLTETWWYLYILGPNNATHLPGLSLGFHEIKKHANQDAPMTDICQLDVAQFHDALLNMGYRHVGNTRRESPARQSQRGLVEVEIGVVGESNESLEKISHDCISRLSIGFLEKYMDLGAM